MTTSRRYVSPKRAAKAEATRRAILEAFRDQLFEPDRETLSPTDAATAAGCSVRTVHGYFPDKESRIAGLAALLEEELYAEPVPIPQTVEDLPDHYRRIHLSALKHPLATALVKSGGPEWDEVRARRRADRLNAVRTVAAGIGAPAAATEQATGVLLALAGAEVTMTMRDQFGVTPEMIPDAVAHVVTLITDDLRRQAE